MLSEVSSKNHPCHVAGSGPEQDYLSRFFAARKESPWHHISVGMELPAASISLCHRKGVGMDSLYAIGERLFRGRKRVVARQVEDELRGHWCSPLQRRGENVAPNFGSYCYRLFGKRRSAAGSESYLSQQEWWRWWEWRCSFCWAIDVIQYGHSLWISKTAEPEDYLFYGCRREGQKIFAGGKDITLALDWMVEEGASCSCDCRAELEQMLQRFGCSRSWALRHTPKTMCSRRLFQAWNSCGSELDDGTR